MAKAMTLVGLDVHARQTHAAVLDPATGELGVSRLRIAPEEVVSFLQRLGAGVRAVYEAGPTGFGLARAAREHGIDVWVAAPGSIPKGPGDRVETDRRDAVRLVRLLAAGELSFAFVPSAADERFRDLVRCIEDARGDLMRARHRLSKFLLRRGERYPGAGRAWTATHMRWLRAHELGEACSQATFADYLAAVELLAGRRRGLLETLERAIPGSSHAPVIARLRCFRGIDTLSAAGLAAEVGDFARFQRPSRLAGFLGIVPSERTSDSKRRQGSITKAGPGHARRLLVEAAHHYRYPPRIGETLARRQQGQDARVLAVAWRAQRRLHQRWQHLHSSGASLRASSRSPARASSPPSSGKPPPLTESTPTIAPGALPGRARAPGRPTTVARGSRQLLRAAGPRRPRPLLDSEPRRKPGLEVKPSNISLTPQPTRLDLPPVPPRQPVSDADLEARIRRRRRAEGLPPYQCLMAVASAAASG